MSLSRAARNTTIRVKLTDGSQIDGQVNISGYDRFSDLITDHQKKFLTITGATLHQALTRASLHQLDIDEPIRHDTMILGKQYIVWAVPEEKD